MRTYGNAVRILEQSDDPEDRKLGEATKSFSARLTDVTTQRGEIAKSLEHQRRDDKASKGLSRDAGSKGGDATKDIGNRDDRGRGPER